jgi:hypothetical protein
VGHRVCVSHHVYVFPTHPVRNRLSVSVCLCLSVCVCLSEHAVWRMREGSGRTYIGTSGGMEALIEGGIHVRDQDSLPRTPESPRG